MHTIFRLEKLKGRDCPEVLDVDGKTVLQWILGKQGDKVRNEFVSRYKPVTGSCEYNNEFQGS